LEFIVHLKQEIINAYGENPELSPDFTRIINTKNWERLINLIAPEKVILGGQSNKENCYLAPTLIVEPGLDSEIMKEEIFGPLLPIISYKNTIDLKNIITNYEKPLSLYVFTTNNYFAEEMIQKFSFGGGCINDTVIHFSNKRLPFGGVGHSGIGAYHGRLGFDTFSHKKAIVKKANWLDLPFRYAPYKGKLSVIKKILSWF
jgi:aldehyde dehydrogenase (NAD+)